MNTEVGALVLEVKEMIPESVLSLVKTRQQISADYRQIPPLTCALMKAFRFMPDTSQSPTPVCPFIPYKFSPGNILFGLLVLL